MLRRRREAAAQVEAGAGVRRPDARVMDDFEAYGSKGHGARNRSSALERIFIALVEAIPSEVVVGLVLALPCAFFMLLLMSYHEDELPETFFSISLALFGACFSLASPGFFPTWLRAGAASVCVFWWIGIALVLMGFVHDWLDFALYTAGATVMLAISATFLLVSCLASE